jgi:hypothetical protein
MQEVSIKIAAALDDFNKAFLSASTKVTGLGKDFDGLNNKLRKASENLTEMGENLSLKVSLPIAALGGLATKNFADSELKGIKLKAVLKSTGDTTLQSKAGIEEYAAKMQGLTGVEDDTIIGLVQLSKQMGLNTGQSKLAVKEAISLNKAFGIDLEAGLKMSAAAMEGNYDKLGKTVPAIKAASTEAEKHAIYQKTLAMAWDTTQAAAQSFSGELEGLKNDLGNASEASGGFIAVGITPIIAGVRSAAQAFQNADESTQKAITYTLLATAAIGPLVIVIGKAVAVYRTAVIAQAAFSAGMEGTKVATGSNTIALIANRTALAAHAIATKASAAASLIFNNVLRANPLAAIVTIALAAGAAIFALVSIFGKSASAADQAREADENLTKAKKGLLKVSDDVTKHIEDEDNKIKKTHTTRETVAVEQEKINAALKLSEDLKNLATIQGLQKCGTAYDEWNAKIQKSDFSANIKDQAAKLGNTFQLYRETNSALDAGVYNRMKNLAKASQEEASGWVKKQSQTQEDAEAERTNKSKEDQKKWAEDTKKIRDEMTAYLATAGKSESEKSDAEYLKDIDHYRQAFDEKRITETEFEVWSEARRQQQVQKEAENDTKIYQTKSKIWTDIWSTSVYFGDKLKEISEAVKNKQISDSQAAGAALVSCFSSAVGGVNDLLNQMAANQAITIDNNQKKETKAQDAKYKADKAAINNSTMTTKQKNAALKKLDDQYQDTQAASQAKYEKQKAKLAYDAAVRAKVIGTFEAVMAIPKVSLDAYKAMVGIPIVGPALALPAAIAAGAFATAKAALIASAPLPAYATGGVFNKASVGVFGEAGTEVALPLSSTQGISALQKISDMIFSDLQSKAASTTTATTTSDDNRPVILNLVFNGIKFGNVITDLASMRRFKIPQDIVFA